MTSGVPRGFLGLDRRGWPGTVVVALIAALIAVGLPLLNGLVSADRPVPAGSTVEVGRGVTFTAADGWTLDAEQTSTRADRVELAQGPLTYAVEAAPATRSLPEEYERMAAEIRDSSGAQLFNGPGSLHHRRRAGRHRRLLRRPDLRGTVRRVPGRTDRGAGARPGPAGRHGGRTRRRQLHDAHAADRAAVTATGPALGAPGPPIPRSWGDTTSVMQPRQPAFWLLVGLMALGTARIGSIVVQAFAAVSDRRRPGRHVAHALRHPLLPVRLPARPVRARTGDHGRRGVRVGRPRRHLAGPVGQPGALRPDRQAGEPRAGRPLGSRPRRARRSRRRSRCSAWSCWC